jgi:uncharacterized protein (DUF1810 family)
MDQYNLSRFIEAQERTYKGAMLELTRGRKDSHWTWYIFPQIDGLGNSEAAKVYSIKSLEEGRAYLEHPVLGSRLVESCEILLSLKDTSMNKVMGFPDDLKLLSSMTLFEFLSDENPIFTKIIEVYFDNNRDENSLRIIHTML